MANYCVNTDAQSNGDHEVHDVSANLFCLPDPVNRLDLGDHSTCQSAVVAAKKYYNQSNGCFYCANPCHSG